MLDTTQKADPYYFYIEFSPDQHTTQT